MSFFSNLANSAAGGIGGAISGAIGSLFGGGSGTGLDPWTVLEQQTKAIQELQGIREKQQASITMLQNILSNKKF